MSARNVKTGKNQIIKRLRDFPQRFENAYDGSAVAKRENGDLSINSGSNADEWEQVGYQVLNGERQFAFACLNSVFKADIVAIVSFDGNTFCDLEIVTRAFANEFYGFGL